MKKKTTKRMLSLLLSVVMVGTLMVGCGDNTDESKTPASSQTPSSQETPSSEEPKEYAPEEELNITIWYAQGTEFIFQNKLEENVVADYLHEKSLVTVGNMYGNDGGSWDVKLSRLIAGNNMPHVVYLGGGQGAAQFTKLADADQIWIISEEMLKEYAPDYYARADKAALEAFKVDGGYMGIPFGFNASTETVPFATQEDIDHINTYIAGVTQNEHMQLLVRDDILTELYPDAMTWADIEEAYEGKPMAHLLRDVPIKTKEDLVDFFRDIKALDAESVNGKTVYAYGYGSTDNWDPLCYMAGELMGLGHHYYTGNWNSKTEEMEILLTSDVLKEAAKIQNQLVIDKVFDPESLVQTSDMYKEKVYNGQYAVCSQGYIASVTILNDQLEASGVDFRYRPLYTQIPLREGYEGTKSVRSYTDSICFTNQLSEDELIQMLNWVNVQATEEFAEVYWWGTPEDGLYTEDADGIRTYKDENMQERFVNNNLGALADADTKGIGNNGKLIGEFFLEMTVGNRNNYSPVVQNKVAAMSLQNAVWIPEAGYESIVTQAGPMDDGWESIYAAIPEVIDFWAERESWENAFKLSLAAEDADDFEKKWQNAVDVLNDVCDVEAMEKAMTDAAKASLEN